MYARTVCRSTLGGASGGNSNCSSPLLSVLPTRTSPTFICWKEPHTRFGTTHSTLQYNYYGTHTTWCACLLPVRAWHNSLRNHLAFAPPVPRSSYLQCGICKGELLLAEVLLQCFHRRHPLRRHHGWKDVPYLG